MIINKIFVLTISIVCLSVGKTEWKEGLIQNSQINTFSNFQQNLSLPTSLPSQQPYQRSMSLSLLPSLLPSSLPSYTPSPYSSFSPTVQPTPQGMIHFYMFKRLLLLWYAYALV